MNIDLSIIVIGYNVEKYIKRCLDSLLVQLNSSCELLFVDDGSEDDTAKLVRDAFADFPNVRCQCFCKKNGGANSARLYGFDKSSGKYVTFIDGDDWVKNNYISKIFEYIQKESDIFVFGYQTVTQDNEIKVHPKIYKNEYRNLEFLDDVFEVKLSHYFWDKVFRREFLENSGFKSIPKITMGDDLAAHVKMGVNKPIVTCSDDILYNYYNDGSGISRKPNPNTVEILETLSYIESVIDNKNLSDHYDELINYHYFRSFLFYVVKNRYGWTDVQGKIYKAWKKKNINISGNKYIQNFMKNKKMELMLANIYNLNYNLGRCFSFIYIKLKRGK